MDKMVTAVIGIVVLIAIIGVVWYALMGSGSKAAATLTTLLTTQYYTNATTTVTSLPSNSSLNNTPKGCTAATYYGCTNVSYTAGSSGSTLSVTISQNTGQLWSGFGIGYAPVGTKLSGGVPQNIVFYTANASSSSNAGTSLASGVPVTITLPISSNATTTEGTIWACYVNSGVVYVGNGCTPQAGVAATYVVVGTINPV